MEAICLFIGDYTASIMLVVCGLGMFIETQIKAAIRRHVNAELERIKK